MNSKILFNIRIGDWSADGHGMYETYTVSSNKPIEEVRAAHYRILEETGIDMGSMCEDYEDSSIDSTMIDKLKSLGVDVNKIDLCFADYKEDGVAYAVPYTLFAIWVHLLNKVDSELKLEHVKIESLDFYGFKDGKHIPHVGYGLFSL